MMMMMMIIIIGYKAGKGVKTFMYGEYVLEGDSPSYGVNWTQKAIMKGFSKDN